MIENDEAVVKTDAAVGQFQIIDGAARQFRLGKIFQIIAPKSETAAEREWQINFIKQFVTRHQAVEQMPRIAELDLDFMVETQFALRTEGTKSQKWICSDKG